MWVWGSGLGFRVKNVAAAGECVIDELACYPTRRDGSYDDANDAIWRDSGPEADAV